MNVLIIEDEYHAWRRLSGLLKDVEQNINIQGPLDSIEDSVQWLKTNELPDLIFMDIQLADGLSFDILKQLKINTPIIFTTAFDEYALKAFKANSVDYLLKPIDKSELTNALVKYKNVYQKQDSSNVNKEVIDEILRNFTKPDYINRFLIKNSNGISFISIDDVSYFYSKDGITRLKTFNKHKHHIDYTLEQLENRLDPDKFFRVNRSMLVSIRSIDRAEDYFNSRLKLKLNPPFSDDTLVSRDRVRSFRDWLGS